jgi:hypothetical protein
MTPLVQNTTRSNIMATKKTKVAAKSTAVATKKKEVVAMPKPTGVQRLRELLAETPTLSQADLTAAVEKEGYKLAASGISSIRYDFLSVVRVLQSKGLLKKPLLN